MVVVSTTVVDVVVGVDSVVEVDVEVESLPPLSEPHAAVSPPTRTAPATTAVTGTPRMMRTIDM
ncbi:hypothetical protein AWB94_13050 [Mycolicibacterium canariasense]|nr:hypothetical protein AWB94_13050 [Mycolicibacterium canariasense]